MHFEAFKPLLFSETIVEEEEGDLCSSNHFILDRIAEKDSTDNLYRAGSESENDNDIDIRQVNKPLHVFIDGPFGAPTSQIFHAQHAVLIGTGIGVTPFASILQSIMHRWDYTFLQKCKHGQGFLLRGGENGEERMGRKGAIRGQSLPLLPAEPIPH